MDTDLDVQGSDAQPNLRKQRRQQEDKKRMAYRRAIEDYRDSQALQAQMTDFPELLGQGMRLGGSLH
ncbi:MAG: transcriptional regulator [Pseudomonadaceae bacterium]|nr:MAG: transcriptional regulator [Pseudomonadaceae bacterium]